MLFVLTLELRLRCGLDRHVRKVEVGGGLEAGDKPLDRDVVEIRFPYPDGVRALVRDRRGNESAGFVETPVTDEIASHLDPVAVPQTSVGEVVQARGM